MSTQDRAIQKLARELAGIKKEVVSWRGPQADYTSIENGGNFTFKDSDGNVTAVVGGQDDGSNTIRHVDGPTPPIPSGLSAHVDGPIVQVSWDGTFESDVTHDWHYLEVLAVGPNNEQLTGTINDLSGGEASLAATSQGDWVIVARSVSRAGKRSLDGDAGTVAVELVGLTGAIEAVQASADGKNTIYYSATMPPGTDYVNGDLWFDTSEAGKNRASVWDGGQWLSVSDERVADLAVAQADIDAAMLVLDGRLDSADADIVSLQGSLADLDSTTLPALRSDLDAAEARLTDAEADLGLVPGAISDAEQAAKDAAKTYTDAHLSAESATLAAAILAAQTTADEALAASDGAIRTYYEATAPTVATHPDLTVGDMWYDTTNELAYRWNGSQWNLIQDSNVAVALAKAEEALAVADGKITSYRQINQPSGGEVGDLWFDTDDGNAPWYCTSASPVTWVRVRDGEIADAELRAAADALAKANAAKDQAQAWDTALAGTINATIDGAVDDLSADISAVQASADGKNTITWNSAAPTLASPGKAVNDIWYRTSGNSIIGYWKWSGSAWVQQTLSATVIPQIDIGTGTFGEMNGARLKAGSVQASSVAVGDFSNLATVDPVRGINVSRPASWATVTDGNYARSAPGTENYLMFKDRTDTVPFKAGDELRISFTGKTVGADTTGRITLWAYPVLQGQTGSATEVLAGETLTFTSSEKNLSTTLKIPDTFGSSAVPKSWIIGMAGAGAWNGTAIHDVRIRDVRIYRMSGSTLIQNGAVTTDKLAANVLEVGNLKAGTAAIAEAVVQKIAAQTASIQTADIKNLFVTGTASLSDVVAERIGAETAEFINLEVANLVASGAVIDEAVIDQLFTDVVVAKMVTATEFIGENAILTGAVTADKLAVGSITAESGIIESLDLGTATVGELDGARIMGQTIHGEQLSGDAIDGKVITGPIIQSAREGQRWVGDTTGIRIFNADNEVRTQLSPDGSVFKGEVEADTLVVNGGSEMRSTENKLAQGAKLTLEAGVTDPTAPPTVQPYWDSLDFEISSPRTNVGGLVGLAYDGTHYWSAHKDDQGVRGQRARIFAVRIDPDTGVGEYVGGNLVATGAPWTSEVFGVTCVGSELFWLGRSLYDGVVWVTDLDGAFKRAFAYPDLNYTRTNPLGYKPGIGNDGTNVVIAQCDDNGPLNIRTVNKTTGALISSAKDASDGTKSDITGVYVGTADWGGSTKYAAVRKASRSQVACFNATTGVYDASKLFETATMGSTGVVFHDGKFHTLDPAGVIHEYADANTGDASGDWWATYRWSVDVDEDGINDSVSRIGPVKRFTWPRRGKLKFLGAPLPVGAGYITPSIAKKATTPVRTDFRTPGFSVHVGESVAFLNALPTDWLSGGSPGDANTFPEAESSVLTTASNTFRLQGDGSGYWGPLTMGRNGIMSGLIVTGQTIAYVDTPDVPKKFTIQLPPGRFTKPPVVWVQSSTAVPNIVSVSVIREEITTTAFNMYFSRGGLVNTGVTWFAMDSE